MATRTRTQRPWRFLLLMIVPPALFLALAVIAAGSLLWGNASGELGGPVAHMQDVAGELTSSIKDIAAQGLAKTNAIALDPRLPAAIAAHDRSAAERLANDLLNESLELDIVAIFDAEGKLLAVNTIGHGGVPVPREALDQIYGLDFSQRGVVRGCLRDTTRSPRMEFQTHCRFAPPFFGSSGLSVAFATPVLVEGNAGCAGVISTRLNFARITALIRENSFVRAGNAIFLVTDSGGFFDEDINSGRVPAPLAAEQVCATLQRDAPEGAGSMVRRDDMMLMSRRVPATFVTDGGGINVLLRASDDWVQGQAMRAKRLAGGALFGSLLAACVWCLYLAARTKQHRAHSALMAERARTSLILENVGESVLSADITGRIGFANLAACTALGFKPGSLIGRELKEFFAEGNPPPVGAPWRAEQTTLKRNDGTTFPARVTCTVLPDGAGGVLAFSDLTEKIETDRKLLDATRQAGMAEVATGVLHNVGNVLNSVNVAACVVASKLKQSEIPNLVRAGDMMHEHRADLQQYLSGDERGKHLPDFLIEVARTLGIEQQSMIEELEAVTKGIEHVKHVVNLQQEHAKKSAVAEMVKPAEVMEAAIQLQLDSLAQHGVAIERRFEPMPPVAADKHLVLQILVNLIANARQAMQDLAPGLRKLILVTRTDRAGDAQNLCFEVIDSGAGIPAENLSRIFGQGFTTKKDGHGFGLHSAANAAKQMGGSLKATSDGAGKGARFVLTLPMSQSAAAKVPAAVNTTEKRS